MRPIKFRAWDKVSKEIVYLGAKLEVPIKGTVSSYRREEEFELMQFTGLLDKDGKEIYEGDVVKIPAHSEGDHGYPESIGQVYFNEEEGVMQIDSKGCGYTSLFDFVNNWQGEVLGNIYENHELISPEKENV